MKFDYAAPAELFITKTQGRYTAAHWLSLLCHYRRGYSLCHRGFSGHPHTWSWMQVVMTASTATRFGAATTTAIIRGVAASGNPPDVLVGFTTKFSHQGCTGAASSHLRQRSAIRLSAMNERPPLRLGQVISTIGTSVMPRRRAADSRPIAADQDQIDEAELGDRGGNLGDLSVRIRAGIAGVAVSWSRSGVSIVSI